MLRCGCFRCWSLSSCTMEYWGFSHYVSFPWNHDLVIIHTSFWRGMNLQYTKASFVCFFLVLWLGFRAHSLLCELQQKRVYLLMASALFQGASIGPLIDVAIGIDPRYAFIAFLNLIAFLDYCYCAFWSFWIFDCK